jgi:NAD(P)-dependent dehydrogenase (short-subunit alcohol dehydrogenase family)
VAAEINDLGGEAVANTDDVADFEAARRLVTSTVERFGRIDALVNNAGILRDRMLVNMTATEWDAVMAVHLRGTFGPSRWAAAHWRELVRAGGQNRARIVNTSSASGIYGNPGQTNSGAAKAGIAAFTVIAAKELARYGVSVNAIAPGARTRMTEGLMSGRSKVAAGDFDPSSPDNIAPLVAWLVSEESEGITGRVFNISGGTLSVAEGWHAGPGVATGGRLEAESLGGIVPGLVAEAAPNADMSGRRPR